MKFCAKCGTEMQDDCMFCPKCGTSAEAETAQKDKVETKAAEVTDKPQKNSKKLIAIAAPIAAVLIVLIIAAIVILPRPNLKMKDLHENSTIGALMQYGIPTGSGDGEWIYEDCIKFHGLKLDRLTYNFKENTITLTEFDDCNELKNIIKNKCDFESYLVYAKYSYDDIEISLFDFDTAVVVKIELD